MRSLRACLLLGDLYSSERSGIGERAHSTRASRAASFPRKSQKAIGLLVYSQNCGSNVVRLDIRAGRAHSFSQRIKMSEVPKGKRVQARQGLGSGAGSCLEIPHFASRLFHVKSKKRALRTGRVFLFGGKPVWLAVSGRKVRRRVVR